MKITKTVKTRGIDCIKIAQRECSDFSLTISRFRLNSDEIRTSRHKNVHLASLRLLHGPYSAIRRGQRSESPIGPTLARKHSMIEVTWRWNQVLKLSKVTWNQTSFAILRVLLYWRCGFKWLLKVSGLDSTAMLLLLWSAFNPTLDHLVISTFDLYV